ncbi:hypothetical protein TREMEDRAFT_62254 [Tremella mesenterica DSM 1558]|uniref:uncharacterized protein n=1 Tax=Tremella mesenterica (strain ATCC 24925 / CBS 8224 / DSM 1558 / NBRC 9311 / NRRL Y-6157 / RJB 2259-6 / UBC 559-6) TaxID=578456 RepID=UPI0003F49E38|nr:uncharacterized protein TREMEDRAFT_62254 [Tremella mesenterica DSM 1558]EIW69390.1 hypothetical protein TREMEDRAFT_62254 [Tremella mesenterica DSM 1558]
MLTLQFRRLHKNESDSQNQAKSHYQQPGSETQGDASPSSDPPSYSTQSATEDTSQIPVGSESKLNAPEGREVDSSHASGALDTPAKEYNPPASGIRGLYNSISHTLEVIRQPMRKSTHPLHNSSVPDTNSLAFRALDLAELRTREWEALTANLSPSALQSKAPTPQYTSKDLPAEPATTQNDANHPCPGSIVQHKDKLNEGISDGRGHYPSDGSTVLGRSYRLTFTIQVEGKVVCVGKSSARQAGCGPKSDEGESLTLSVSSIVQHDARPDEGSTRPSLVPEEVD